MNKGRNIVHDVHVISKIPDVGTYRKNHIQVIEIIYFFTIMFLFSLIPYAGSVFNLKSTGVTWSHGFLYSWIRDSAIKFSDVWAGSLD